MGIDSAFVEKVKCVYMTQRKTAAPLLGLTFAEQAVNGRAESMLVRIEDQKDVDMDELRLLLEDMINVILVQRKQITNGTGGR